jgi:hypothetical protein
MTDWRVGSGIGAVVGALGQVWARRALELRLKVPASQSSAPSIGIDFNPEWLRGGLTPLEP